MQNHFSERNDSFPTMTLTGNGRVTAIPDQAVIRLGVKTTGDNLTDIQSVNAEISEAILQALKQMGVSDIKTFQYSIDKQYDYQNGNRIDKGYLVSNIFEIRTDRMDQVGAIIDTAVNSGANSVDFISFEVSDSDFYYRQALNLAILDAYQKAESIMKTLELTMDPVPVRITENSVIPVPYRANYSLREGITTPIEPGNKQIEASATVEFRYQ